jgi:hypothetical protein
MLLLRIALIAFSFFLACVFVGGFAVQLRDPSRSRTVVSNLGFPPWFASAAGGVEAGIAVCLVAAPAVGGSLAGIYLVAVSAAMGVAKMSGRQVDDCGCFGEKHAVDSAYFLRNAVLFIFAASVAVWAPRGFVPRGLLVAVAVALVATWGLASLARASRRSAERFDLADRGR